MWHWKMWFGNIHLLVRYLITLKTRGFDQFCAYFSVLSGQHDNNVMGVPSLTRALWQKRTKSSTCHISARQERRTRLSTSWGTAEYLATNEPDNPEETDQNSQIEIRASEDLSGIKKHNYKWMSFLTSEEHYPNLKKSGSKSDLRLDKNDQY